jgi:hypothetical protein
MRVIEPRGGVHLPEESLGADARGQLRVKHLHRDRPIVPDVLGEVDRGHAASAELSLYRVAAG